MWFHLLVILPILWQHICSAVVFWACFLPVEFWLSSRLFLFSSFSLFRLVQAGSISAEIIPKNLVSLAWIHCFHSTWQKPHPQIVSNKSPFSLGLLFRWLSDNDLKLPGCPRFSQEDPWRAHTLNLLKRFFVWLWPFDLSEVLTEDYTVTYSAFSLCHIFSSHSDF